MRPSHLLLCLLAMPLSSFAAVTQADLQGYWSGTLTNANATTVYKLAFMVDGTGAISGTGDGAPINSSTLLVQDGSADTVKGTLHWFYVDTGVFYKWDSIKVLPAANGQFSLIGTVVGSAYIAPMPPHDTGTWTLSITGGNGAVTPLQPPGSILFNVTKSKVGKSDVSVKLTVPKAYKTVSGLTLTINSASFPVASSQVKLSNGTLTAHARGLNLIELFGIDMSTAMQMISVPLSIVGVDTGGNTVTFIDGTVMFKVAVKNGTAKGSRAP